MKLIAGDLMTDGQVYWLEGVEPDLGCPVLRKNLWKLHPKFKWHEEIALNKDNPQKYHVLVGDAYFVDIEMPEDDRIYVKAQDLYEFLAKEFLRQTAFVSVGKCYLLDNSEIEYRTRNEIIQGIDLNPNDNLLTGDYAIGWARHLITEQGYTIASCLSFCSIFEKDYANYIAYQQSQYEDMPPSLLIY